MSYQREALDRHQEDAIKCHAYARLESVTQRKKLLLFIYLFIYLFIFILVYFNNDNTYNTYYLTYSTKNIYYTYYNTIPVHKLQYYTNIYNTYNTHNGVSFLKESVVK